MKKIIIPFDGGHFSKGAFLFAQKLHQIRSILLTGVFLPEAEFEHFFILPAAFMGEIYIPVKERVRVGETEENVQLFTTLCQKNGIEYRVHKDLSESAVKALTKETRFADMMIIGSEKFFKNEIVYGSDQYLKDMAHNTECPVMIVPEKFTFPSRIILAYDGSASSVYAIKQFASLFPELCNRKTILLYSGDQKHDIPDDVLIEELVARHFSDLTITKLTPLNNNDINNWFEEHKESIVVSGAFGRSGISEVFHKSFIMDLIRRHQTPVFIAHK